MEQTPPVKQSERAASAVTGPTPEFAPDWELIAREVLCPLCGYNLRGLAAPRCPECGYAFAWVDLLRERPPLHPYLFESHPASNVRTFLRTFLGGLVPRRFWRRLTPIEPPRPFRLVLYWSLAIPMSLLLAASIFLAVAAWENESDRRQFSRALTATYRGAPMTAQDKTAVSLAVDSQFPPTVSLKFLDEAFENSRYAAELAVLGAIYAAWPWVTFATLMIFRSSMRRAKVRTFHVLRCVLYNADSGLVLGVAIYLVLCAVRVFGNVDPESAATIAGLAIISHYTYRLAYSYELYVRFDHPWATALASQIIVILLIACIAVNV